MAALIERRSCTLSLAISVFVIASAGIALRHTHWTGRPVPAMAPSGFSNSQPDRLALSRSHSQAAHTLVFDTAPYPFSSAAQVARPASLLVKPSLPASAQLQRSHFLFERNDGQEDPEVLYLSHGPGYSLFLTRTGATVVLRESQKKQSGRANPQPRYFTLRFGDANPQTDLIGIEILPGISNYFSGSDPKLWHTRIPQFAKVRYSNLYPGIDLIFYFRDGQLEYDVIAAPGADPNAIHLQVEGATPSLTREGDVAIKTGANQLVRLRKPYAYQGSEPATVVPTSYSLHHGSLSFALGKYDRRHPLVIDPALIFATFITSNCATCFDNPMDIAADNTGVYLTGSTTAAIFPAVAGRPTSSTPQIAQTFVVKIDPTGSHILYSTFLGNSMGQSIAVDSLGSAYVSGTAHFPVPAGFAAFPLTSGVFSGTTPANAAGNAAYAAKLSPDGATVAYSTLLQQPMAQPVSAPYPLVQPNKIAVDSTGALYVAGLQVSSGSPTFAVSSWMPLPVTVGAFQTTAGSAFVLKLTPNASGLDYATYIDTPGIADSVAGIAVDSTGDAFVAGSTSSSTFPTTQGSYQPSNPATTPGDSNAFVMELNPGGTALVYSTYFGTSGQNNTLAFGLALDSHGQAVIAGYSLGSLPVTPNQPCGNSASNTTGGYAAKLNASGSGLIYLNTFCDLSSQAASVAVDPTGAAYVAGISSSPATFQPILLQPIQGYLPSTSGAANIALKFDTSGVLQWSTFFGNNASGIIEVGVPAPRIAVDANGSAYILGTSTIPPTLNSVGPLSLAQGVGANNGEGLNVLLKIAPSLGAPVPIVSPRQLSFTSQNVGTSSAPVDVQVGNFGDAPTSPTVAITDDFSETDNCSVAVPGGQKCDINVVFKPSATGPRTGSLTVSFGGTIPSQTVALGGNAGASAVTLSPTSQSFPVQATGTTSGAQQITITNSGTGPLTISSLQTSGPFATTNTCGAPVAPTNECTVQITFTPTGSGTQIGTLTITDNAANSPQTVALTGTGTTGSPSGIGLGVASGGSASAMINAGATATYSLSIGGQGMTGTATLTCASAPTGATCSVPATVPLSASIASTFNATVTTTARSNVWFYPTGPAPWLWALAILGCLTVMKVASAQQFPRLRWRFAPLLAVALCACGGNSNAPPTNGTPAGAYTIVVTAKSGTTTQTQNLALTVQ